MLQADPQHVQQLEDVIDTLLSYDVTAINPCSMSVNSYLQLLQPLQLALQYTWFLYSRDSRQQGMTAGCLTAANAFSGGLRRYLKAAQSDLSALHKDSGAQLRSEALRAQLKPLKKLHAASRASMKVHIAAVASQVFAASTGCVP